MRWGGGSVRIADSFRKFFSWESCVSQTGALLWFPAWVQTEDDRPYATQRKHVECTRIVLVRYLIPDRSKENLVCLFFILK